MTPAQQQKEAEIQHKVNEELQKVLESKEYGVDFIEGEVISKALKRCIQSTSPDRLGCSFETFKVLYMGEKPIKSYTFHEIRIAFEAIAAATPDELNFKGITIDTDTHTLKPNKDEYISIQEYVRAKAKDWSTTVQAKRDALVQKYRAISKLALA